MKGKILLMALLLGLIPCIVGGQEIDLPLGIGDNTTINCTDSSAFYNISCQGMCEDPCFTDVSLNPNQTYELKEGKCDLRFACVGQPFPASVDFPGMISMVKENTTLELNIDIKDWLGRPYMNRTWGFDYNEFEIVKAPFDFECPAGINEDINWDSCMPFLSKALEDESGTLSFQLSMLNQKCFSDLTDCHSREMLNDKIADDCEAKYSRAFNDYENEYRKYEDCVIQLDETNENTKVGSYKAEVDDFNEQIRRGQLVPREDHDYVVAVAWIIGFILAVLFVWAFFGGGSEL